MGQRPSAGASPAAASAQQPSAPAEVDAVWGQVRYNQGKFFDTEKHWGWCAFAASQLAATLDLYHDDCADKLCRELDKGPVMFRDVHVCTTPANVKYIVAVASREGNTAARDGASTCAPFPGDGLDAVFVGLHVDPRDEGSTIAAFQLPPDWDSPGNPDEREIDACA